MLGTFASLTRMHYRLTVTEMACNAWMAVAMKLLCSNHENGSS